MAVCAEEHARDEGLCGHDCARKVSGYDAEVTLRLRLLWWPAQAKGLPVRAAQQCAHLKVLLQALSSEVLLAAGHADTRIHTHIPHTHINTGEEEAHP